MAYSCKLVQHAHKASRGGQSESFRDGRGGIGQRGRLAGVGDQSHFGEGRYGNGLLGAYDSMVTGWA